MRPLKRGNLGMDTQGKLGKDAGSVAYLVRERPRTQIQCRHACSCRVYFSCERNSTAALNFCGGRFLNDGIGAVGFTSVRAIPWRGSRDPMWVS
jgi:hypothetical protein